MFFGNVNNLSRSSFLDSLWEHHYCYYYIFLCFFANLSPWLRRFSGCSCSPALTFATGSLGGSWKRAPAPTIAPPGLSSSSAVLMNA